MASLLRRRRGTSTLSSEPRTEMEGSVRKATSTRAQEVSCQPSPGSRNGGPDTSRCAVGIRRALASKFGLLTLVALVLLAVIGVAAAASAGALSLSGGEGTTVFDDQLYAKEGGVVTATVTTTPDTECVVIFVNGEPVTSDASADGATSWTLSFSAGAGDGVRQIRATAYSTTDCEHSDGSATESMVLDNTGPAVEAKPSPIPNDAGWNNVSPVTVTWSAVDNGFSGVLIDPSPRKQDVDGETSGTTLDATATDRLGNVGEGSIVVKIDATPPQIVGERSPEANGFGWNNSPVTVTFRCSDALSGVVSCSPARTIRTEGTTTVTGAAVDVAGNRSTDEAGNVAERSVNYHVIAAVSTFSVRARLHAQHRRVSARVRRSLRRGALVGTLTVDGNGQNRLVWRLVLRGPGSRRARAEIRIGKRHHQIGLTLCGRCRLRTRGNAVITLALAPQIISGAADVEVRLARHAAPVLIGDVRVQTKK